MLEYRRFVVFPFFGFEIKNFVQPPKKDLSKKELLVEHWMKD
jgi:hypothetical protein